MSEHTPTVEEAKAIFVSAIPRHPSESQIESDRVAGEQFDGMIERVGESAAAGANVVGRDALVAFLDDAGINSYDGADPDAVADTLLSPSGPLRDEAVVKAEALTEAAKVAFRDKSIQGLARIVIGNWLTLRAAALLATTTTDANDDETETR
jgi:hypothetical protein